MKKLVKYIGIWLGIVVILELSIFNIEHWLTINNKPQIALNSDYEIGSGLQYVNGRYVVNDVNEAWIQFNELDVHIQDLYLNIENANNPKVNVIITASDEANSLGMTCYSTTICHGVYGSYFKMVHFSGDSTFLKLQFTDQGAGLNLNDVTINAVIPFEFSKTRCAVLFILGVFFILFRPSSSLWQEKIVGCQNKQVKFGIVLLVASQCLVFGWIGQVIDPNTNIGEAEGWPATHQYNELANALIEGHFYLNRVPPSSLAEMDNPYDTGARNQYVVEEKGESVDIDYAYYNGKYYSYFGVVPALLFYVPYKLVVGTNLMSWNLCAFMSILTMIAIFSFVYELCRNYFKASSVASYMLLSLFITYASSMIYLDYYGVVYSVPIVCSLFFDIAGLTLWMRAKDESKIKKVPMVIGSLSIALTLGCRPQFILAFLFAIPIFWDETIKQRQFFSVKGLRNTVLIMLPFIIVGVWIMYYNYARFDSPFDFGATYNLTGFDMTHKKFDMARFPLGIFAYLLQPFTVSANFPFIRTDSTLNSYLGHFSYEPMYGSTTAYSVLLWVNLLMWRVRKELNEKRVLLFSIVSLILGLFIVGVDIQMVGYTQRYLSDFSWLLAISASIVIFTMESKYTTNNNYGIATIHFRRELFTFGVCICIIFNLWTMLVDGRYGALIETNPSLYYKVKDLVLFFT